MRPIRLELSGFTAFREEVEVDFGDADLFSLTGPTGSGKSSLIDAMTFALYGSVPRYGHEGLVAPVITQGRVEARVRFDFSVHGDPYTAVRVVRRTGPNRATTKEARLEGGEEVLAGTAAEVTEAIERLLGLRFEHFTKCVVLPQGEFARFLHDTPGKRQELLRRLLDLEAYRRMMELANRRAAAAESRVELLEERLGELADATPETRRRAAERLEALEGLREEVEASREPLGRMEEELREARERAGRLEESVRTLEGLEVPEEAGALAQELAEARTRVEQEETALRAAREAVEEAEEALGELPARGELELTRELHRARAARIEQVEEAAARLEGATARETVAREEVREAEAARREAVEAWEDARRRHAAHDLRTGLRPGDACPVCGRPIEELPSGEPPALEEARRTAEEAKEVLDGAERSLREAEAARIEAETRATELRGELDTLDERLADRPGPEEVDGLLDRVSEAEQISREAREAARRVAGSMERARQELERLAERERAAWRTFDAARDRLASLSPPPPEREDLAEDWERLADWAEEALEGCRHELVGVRERVQEVEGEVRTLRERLRASATAQGIEVGEEQDVWRACVAELTRQRAELDRIEEAVEEAERLGKERDERREEHQVARELARHLGAQGFEKWVLDEALEVLVAGANAILRELSDGHYSLALDERGDFQVIDHLNADEERSAKTLSGGETFLASLSLALSLADRLAEMSAYGGSRLESIFLDEGFGTLDAETLETVASVIHELGASGRTVGLVTHVRELAEQVPVRFEVRKGPRTATVERVTA